MPKTTIMGMVSVLTTLPMPDYRVVLNITPLNVENEIKTAEREYEALQSSMSGQSEAADAPGHGHEDGSDGPADVE